MTTPPSPERVEEVRRYWRVGKVPRAFVNSEWDILQAVSAIDDVVAAYDALTVERDRLRAALETIISASDQCRGHRDCGHSMEGWTLARAILAEPDA